MCDSERSIDHIIRNIRLLDLSQYDYLLQKLHYDPEDNAVFKCHSIIAALEGNIVLQVLFEVSGMG